MEHEHLMVLVLKLMVVLVVVVDTTVAIKVLVLQDRVQMEDNLQAQMIDRAVAVVELAILLQVLLLVV